VYVACSGDDVSWTLHGTDVVADVVYICDDRIHMYPCCC